jgi:hypothetical protein
MNKIIRQLKTENRKNLYVGISSDVYDWIHQRSSELEISKAMLVDKVLEESMAKEKSGQVIFNKLEMRTSKKYE